MWSPKNSKFAKFHKNRHYGLPVYAFNMNFGNFALCTKDFSFLTFDQIEACRKVLSKHFKKRAKIFIRAFPCVARTKKPNEVRMGKGKGAHDLWYFPAYAGSVLFELKFRRKLTLLHIKKLRDVFQVLLPKLPVKCSFMQLNKIKSV